MRKFDVKFLVVTLILVLLSACGGGNDSSSPTSQVTTYPLKAAWVNYLSDTRSYSYSTSGVTTPVPVSGVLTQSALQTEIFENASALMKHMVSTGVLKINGQSSSFTESDTLYVDSNYNPLGVVEDSDNDQDNGVLQYSVVSSAITIPATVEIGDSGMLFAAERFSSRDKSVRLGKKTMAFSLEPESARTAILKFSEIDYGLDGIVEGTVITVFRILPSGELTRISELDYVDDVPVNVEYKGL